MAGPSSAALMRNVMGHACLDHTSAARLGHLACLQSLHVQGSFLGFHDACRAQAGEARKREAWDAAIAACRAGHADVLAWLLQGKWPSETDAAVPWYLSDLADRKVGRGGSWRPPYIPGLPPEGSTWFVPAVRLIALAIEEGRVAGPSGDSSGAEEVGQRSPSAMPAEALRIDGCLDPLTVWDARWAGVRDNHEFDGSGPDTSFAAADEGTGSMACLRALIDAGCRSEWVCPLAASSGNLRALRYAAQHRCPCDVRSLHAAASAGHLDCLAFATREVLLRNPSLNCPRGHLAGSSDSSTTRERICRAACAAAENGDVDCLNYLLSPKNFGELIKQASANNPVVAAAEAGQLDTLIAACDAGCEFRIAAAVFAAEGGHDRCLQYLLSQGAEIGPIAAEAAALGGSLECLRILHASGCDWDELTPTAAAMAGSLPCLQYALDGGCAVEADFIMEQAAEAGSVSCMAYLHERDFPAGHGTLRAAVRSRSLECMRYAFEIGSPVDPDTTRLVVAAQGGIAFLECAHAFGCPWAAGTIKVAASFGDLPSLRYAHENGCPWDPDTLECAVVGGNLQCLQYVIQNGCPRPAVKPRFAAGSLDVLRYAHVDLGSWGADVVDITAKQMMRSKDLDMAKWETVMYLDRIYDIGSWPARVAEAVTVRRDRAKAVAGCFYIAARLGERGGPHAPMWTHMGQVPPVLVERIAHLAHLTVTCHPMPRQRLELAI